MYTHTYKTVITVSKVTMCHDHLDAGGFRQVEETILLLTWHKVQDTELHMCIRSYKSITNYDIILCPSYNNYNNNQDTAFLPT